MVIKGILSIPNRSNRITAGLDDIIFARLVMVRLANYLFVFCVKACGKS